MVKWRSQFFQGVFKNIKIFVCFIILLTTIACNIPSNILNSQKIEPMNPKNVNAIVWQGGNYLWVSNSKGVGRWDISHKAIEIFQDIDACRGLTITFNPETIWCNSSKYDGITWHQSDLNLRKIIQVNNEVIWAGSEQGLMKFDQTQQKWENVIKTIPHTPTPFVVEAGNGIHLSLASSDGYLWFISSDDPYRGTTRWTETSYQSFLLAEWGSSLLVPLLEANDGSIWGGGNDGLIGRWDGSNWQNWRITFGTALPAIVEIAETQDEMVWVRANVDGVGRWDGNNWQTWGRREGIGDPTKQSRLVLTSMIVTDGNNVWVASEEGINRWNGEKWRRYTIADGLSSDNVTVLSKSPDGMLWAGTWGGGVNYYNSIKDQWKSFP